MEVRFESMVCLWDDAIPKMFLEFVNLLTWKSHSTLTLLATQNYPFLLKYDCPLWLK